MAEFSSYQSYRHFRSNILYHSRYFRDSATEEFLSTVLETSKGREQEIPAGAYFWRAQLGNDWEPLNPDNEEEGMMPSPFSPDRMKPLRNMAVEGRANPKGLPYLYVATDEETAMAEVRPWIGSYISLGHFKTNRRLLILNFSNDQPHRLRIFLSEEEPEPNIREEEVWADINNSFSTPVTMSDRTADYVPTQVLAEFFRTHGFDGIAYRSSLGRGYNLAIFDVDSADLIGCGLFEVRSISFDFQEAANPYVVKELDETS